MLYRRFTSAMGGVGRSSTAVLTVFVALVSTKMLSSKNRHRLSRNDDVGTLHDEDDSVYLRAMIKQGHKVGIEIKHILRVTIKRQRERDTVPWHVRDRRDDMQINKSSPFFSSLYVRRGSCPVTNVKLGRLELGIDLEVVRKNENGIKDVPN